MTGRRGTIAIFDVMASLAIVLAGTQSVFETEEDDDMTPVGSISKIHQTRTGRRGVAAW